MKNLLLFAGFLLPIFLLAQSGNIQGTISDENGIHMPGATVFITSISKGGITNFDGRYTIVDVPDGTYT